MYLHIYQLSKTVELILTIINMNFIAGTSKVVGQEQEKFKIIRSRINAPPAIHVTINKNV